MEFERQFLHKLVGINVTVWYSSCIFEHCFLFLLKSNSRNDFWLAIVLQWVLATKKCGHPFTRL